MSNCDKPICEKNPSPMYSSVTYTLFTPGQAIVPPEYAPGWNMAYPANQIAWEPNPCAPSCIRNAGITNFDQWIDWVYCQLIRLFCDWAKMPCNILVGGKLMSVGTAIADCLKLDTVKNTIVYDETNKVAVAGSVITEQDCHLFFDSAASCIKSAVPADPTPVATIGKLQGDTKTPRKFSLSSQKLTDIRHKIRAGSAENRIVNVIEGQRLVPLAQDTINDNPNEGNNYVKSSGSIFISKDGFYRFGITNFVDLTYTTKTGVKALCHLIAGYVLEDPVTTAKSETRTFQTPIWREHLTRQRIAVKWYASRFLKAGTKVTPRIWLTIEENDQMEVNMAVNNQLAQVLLQRIPNQSFS